jgi:hypothetical protein
MSTGRDSGVEPICAVLLIATSVYHEHTARRSRSIGSSAEIRPELT